MIVLYAMELFCASAMSASKFQATSSILYLDALEVVEMRLQLSPLRATDLPLIKVTRFGRFKLQKLLS